LTVSDLTHSSIDPVSPKINWARIDEADNFAETVKLYRQGKYDEDSFRRFRLQHGAYGTRMTSDYAMVRVKLPAGEIYPKQFEKLSQLSEQYSIGVLIFQHVKIFNYIGLFLKMFLKYLDLLQKLV